MAENKKRDRISIDLGELRERIENVRDDTAWQELTITQKIRTLIRDQLDALEKRKKVKAKRGRNSSSPKSSKGGDA